MRRSWIPASQTPSDGNTSQAQSYEHFPVALVGLICPEPARHHPFFEEAAFLRSVDPVALQVLARKFQPAAAFALSGSFHHKGLAVEYGQRHHLFTLVELDQLHALAASAFLYFLHFLKLPDSVKAKAIFLFQFEDEESLDILLGSLFTSFDCDESGTF